jgi:hypothetical protein
MFNGKVKKIEIYTSLESTEAHAEYARDGLNYNDWKNNLHKILTLTDVNVAIMTTVNILSLPSFVDFIELIMQYRIKYNHGFEHNRIPISINIMRWPPHLQCTLLDEETRIQYANTIENICKGWLKYYSPDKYARIYLEEFDQIQRFCDYLRTSETAIEHRKDFVKFVTEYDKRRSKNFKDVFVEFIHLLEEWE